MSISYDDNDYTTGTSATDKGPIDGSNRTKQCTYSKLNCFKLTVLTFTCDGSKRVLCVLQMLNLFEIELFLIFKLFTYVELNCLK